MNMMPIIIGSFALIAVFLPAIISTPHPARTLLYAVLAELATLAPILFTSSPINTTLIQYAIAKYAMTVAGFLHILHIKSTLLFAPTKTYVSNVVMHHTLAITFGTIEVIHTILTTMTTGMNASIAVKLLTKSHTRFTATIQQCAPFAA